MPVLEATFRFPEKVARAVPVVALFGTLRTTPSVPEAVTVRILVAVPQIVSAPVKVLSEVTPEEPEQVEVPINPFSSIERHPLGEANNGK